MSSAHVSPNLAPEFAPGAGAEALSVAIIGPQEKSRRQVAAALTEAHCASVCAFDSYRPADDHLQRLATCEVVLLDGDSDPELALRLLKELRDRHRVSLIVYSERADQNLAARFLRAGAREYLALPVDAGAISQALVRAQSLRPTLVSAEKPQGSLLVLAGSKGGSGVTTIACNLALALARVSEKNVLLIDLALPIGDAALSMGVVADFSTEDAFREIDRLDAGLLEKFLVRHRSGLSVLAAPTAVPDLEISAEAIEKLIAVARRKFDHVVVDVGSRIDVAGKALFQAATTIYLVTQTGTSDLRNSNRVIAQFFGEGSPNLEVVMNRFEPRSPEAIDEEAIARAVGRPVQWKIPEDQVAAQARYGEEGLAGTHIARISQEMAAAAAGVSAPQNKKSSSEQGGFGRSVAQVNPRENDPHNVMTMAAMEDQSDAPLVTWPTPAPIAYGDKLGAGQLNATASVPGKFVYTPGPGYRLPTGTHTLWVTFTPEASGEEPLQVAVSIVVNKATPKLTWPSPAEIATGTPLDETHLNASSTVPGDFHYSPGPGEVLSPGPHSLAVTFTPADTTNYTQAQATQSITVVRSAPPIDWPTPDAIFYGTPLSAKQLCASAPVAGKFEYIPAPGAILAAGRHPLCAVFTPLDTKAYTRAQCMAEVTVTQAEPSIQWPAPPPLPHGRPLGPEQLNATAEIPGSFTYTPAVGEVLHPGVHQLRVLFKPADTVNYTLAQAMVSILVVEKQPVQVEWPTPAAISYGSPLEAAQLNARASVPGKFHYSPAAGHILAPGRYTLCASFTPEDPEQYATAHATVELEVKGLPDIPSSSTARILKAVAPAPEQSTAVSMDRSSESKASQTKQPEIRVYKGAVYEKGEDGQWHLQKK